VIAVLHAEQAVGGKVAAPVVVKPGLQLFSYTTLHVQPLL
jgi:hypothetical protein